jgi:hypothetical protein
VSEKEMIGQYLHNGMGLRFGSGVISLFHAAEALQL